MAFDVSLRDGGSGAFDVSLSTPAAGGGIAPIAAYYRRKRGQKVQLLKQSTSVDVPIGPFVDATDAVTAETALTITQPDIRLKKGAAAWAQKAAAQTLSHEENGWYEVTLDATDTGTLGKLMLAVHEAGALPVWHEFLVVPANIFDSLVDGTDTLDVAVTSMAAGVVTAAAIAADAITDAKVASDVTIASVTGAVGSVTGAVGSVSGAVGSVTAGVTLADGAITAAKIATGAIDADAIAADAVTEIQAGLATAAALATVDDFLDTEIAAILADTNELQTDWVNGGRLDLLIDAIKAKTDALPAAPAATGDIPSAASIADAVWDEDATAHQTQGTFGQAIGDPAADTDTIWGLVNTNLNATVGSRASQTSLDTVDDFLDTEIAAILADTNELQTDFVNGGRLDLLVDAIKAKTDVIPASPAAVGSAMTLEDGAITAAKLGADAITAAKVAADAVAEIQSGLATAAALATVDTVADAIKVVTDRLDTAIELDGAVYRYTVNALELAPSGGGGGATAEAIADAVLDEAMSGHVAAGSLGKAIADILVDTGEIGAAGAGLTAVASQASIDALPGVLSGVTVRAYPRTTDTENFEVIQGDDYSVTAAMTWVLNGAPDLTGETVMFETLHYSKACEVTGSVMAGWTVVLKLTPVQSAALRPGSHNYDLEATVAGTTLVVGVMTVTAEN